MDMLIDLLDVYSYCDHITVLGVLVASLVVMSMVAPVFASTEPGHTAACSYVKAVPGSPCTYVAPVHVHDAACGYKEGRPEVPCTFKCDHTTCAYVEEVKGGCTTKFIASDICIPGITHTGLACEWDSKKPGTPCGWDSCKYLRLNGHLDTCNVQLGGPCASAAACNAAANSLKVTTNGHQSGCGYVAEIPEVPCNVWKPAGEICTATGVLHTGPICDYKVPVKGVDCDTVHVHDAACGFVAKVDEVPCTYVAPVHVHNAACGYIAKVDGVDCDCKLGGVVTFTHRIPVSFKPERDSARAPNNTWFAFDYTLGKDSNYADTSYITGGYGGGGYNNWGYGGFGGRRAPGYGRGYGSSNGVASGYIEITAEAGNYVLTVTRVAIKGYTINPASITIRFTILENGRIRFNTYATRADFTYKRDDVVKKPAHNNPKTSDATNVALWSSMAVTSMAGVVVALKKRMFK
ncbi:MAG: hypothetical protein FWG10_12000 [Eubacteriaceae bacterium]|nr:hypothetical protein [Eubacteriaceae bacterium]